MGKSIYLVHGLKNEDHPILWNPGRYFQFGSILKNPEHNFLQFCAGKNPVMRLISNVFTTFSKAKKRQKCADILYGCFSLVHDIQNIRIDSTRRAPKRM